MTANRNILARIQENYGLLRKSERLVADHLREHASERLDMSITEMANLLGVSEATISRFTRALGYKGFSDMKLTLASESQPAQDYPNIPAAMKESDSLVEISEKLLGALGACMSETQKYLDYRNIQAAIDNVLKTQNVILFGVGGAASVCEEASHLLLKAGLQARSHSDGYTQLIAATTATEKVTVIGVSHTGMTGTVAKALALARKRGAMTIAITNALESPVGQAGEIPLLTWTHDAPQIPLYGDFLEGRVCQLYIIYLIYLGVLFQSGGAVPKSLRSTAASLEAHYARG